MKSKKSRMDIENTVEQFSNTIFKVAFSYTGSREMSEDILQDVLIKYMTSNKEFENIDHKKAWIIKVTINECKKYFRFLHYQYEKVEKISKELNLTGCSDPAEQHDIYYAIQDLSAKYRIVIHLYYYEELSVKEIGKILRMKDNTIMSLLHRARQKLKKIMEEEYEY